MTHSGIALAAPARELPRSSPRTVCDTPYWDEAVETLPRAELESLQLASLRDHLEHAYGGSPWYRRAFDDAGLLPRDVRNLADLARFPLLDKKLVRDRQLAAPLL